MILVLAFTLVGFGVSLVYVSFSLSIHSTISLALIPLSLIPVSSGLHLIISSLIYSLRLARGGGFWPCECPLCSLTALRLGLNGPGYSEFKGSHGEDVVEAESSLLPLSGSTSSESSKSEGERVNEVKQEGESVREHNVASDGVMEAISSLAEELKDLKEGFSASLEELRSAIASLKSDVDEVRNPFNYMRSIAEFLDEDTRNAILALANMMGLRGEGGHQAEVRVQHVHTSPGVPLVHSRSSHDGILDFLELLLWLDSIYDTREWSMLREMVDVLSNSRLVPESKLRVLRTAMDLVERSRIKGEKVSEKARLLYMVMRQLGVTGGDRGFRLLELIMGGR